MIKPIRRPDWSNLIALAVTGDVYTKTCNALNKWFDVNIKPTNELLSEGVEVYTANGYDGWYKQDCITSHMKERRALLIGVEQIKKETAEDVLREVFNRVDKYDLGSYLHGKIERVLKESDKDD